MDDLQLGDPVSDSSSNDSYLMSGTSSESSSSDSESDSESGGRADVVDVPHAVSELHPHTALVESDDDDRDIQNFTACIDRENEPECLHDYTDTTVDEAVLSFMQAYIDHKKTKCCLKTDLQNLHLVLPKPNEMPKSVYHLLNYVEKYSPQTQITAYYCCSTCQMFYGTEAKEVCPACGNNGSITYYILDIVDQIAFLLEKRGLGELINKFNENRTPLDSNGISDIPDGSEYKRVNADKEEFDISYFQC